MKDINKRKGKFLPIILFYFQEQLTMYIRIGNTSKSSFFFLVKHIIRGGLFPIILSILFPNSHLRIETSQPGFGILPIKMPVNPWIITSDYR